MRSLLRSSILASCALIAAGTCRGEPLASGDAVAAKDESNPRNFDWTRPLPEELAPNPVDPIGPRPHLSDVGPWSSEVQWSIGEVPASWTTTKADRPSNWSKPRPQEISPNPATPAGTRPYLRSLGAGVAARQGEVRNYTSVAFDGPNQRTHSGIAGGGTVSAGSGNSSGGAANDARIAGAPSRLAVGGMAARAAPPGSAAPTTGSPAGPAHVATRDLGDSSSAGSQLGGNPPFAKASGAPTSDAVMPGPSHEARERRNNPGGGGVPVSGLTGGRGASEEGDQQASGAGTPNQRGGSVARDGDGMPWQSQTAEEDSRQPASAPAAAPASGPTGAPRRGQATAGSERREAEFGSRSGECRHAKSVCPRKRGDARRTGGLVWRAVSCRCGGRGEWKFCRPVPSRCWKGVQG